MRIALGFFVVFVLTLCGTIDGQAAPAALGRTIEAHAVPSTPGPWSNDCAGWAGMLGKQNVVAGSVSMHMLGCDDNVTPKKYHATAGTKYYPRAYMCSKRARAYARAGWFGRPAGIVINVKRDLPFCFLFEDGTYGAD